MKPLDVQTRSLELQTMDPIPIADLEPSTPSQDRRHIKAVVTLIWPFSSSTESAALLLAEPDFRLRRSKGQVRVRFVGPSGRAIAESRISSGDEVILGLGGAEWSKDQESLKTPGKNVDWELCFRRKLSIQIRREGQQLAFLHINEPASFPEPHLQPPTPPRSKSPLFVELTAPGPVATPDHVKAWSSPAYLKRPQASESQLLRWPYDPFAEEDGYVEGRGRKRTKFWRASGNWRYLDRTPSPERVKDGRVAQKAVEPAGDVVMESEVEGGQLEIQAISTMEPPGENNDAQEQTRQALQAGNDVATTEASILRSEEVWVEVRKDETASTQDELRSIAMTAEPAAVDAIKEPKTPLKPSVSQSNGAPQQIAEVVPSDSFVGGQQVVHGGWDQAIQQARFEAELYGGDTEENTEYETSQGVEQSSAADDGETTPKQGLIGPISFSHPPSLQQTNPSVHSPTRLQTPLGHDQPPLSPRLPPVASPSLPLVSPYIGPVPARLDRSPPTRHDEQEPSQHGDAGCHSPGGTELDELKQQQDGEEKLHNVHPFAKHQTPQTSDPGHVPPDFGLDGAFFSRPGLEVPVTSLDEINNQQAYQDTEESLETAANQQQNVKQNVVTPHVVPTMPDALLPEELEQSYLSQVRTSPAAQRAINQQLQAEASRAALSTAAIPAVEGDLSEEQPPRFHAPAAEDGTPPPHTPSSQQTVITSRLQIGTFDEDPPYVASNATEIRNFDVRVSRGANVLKHHSLTPIQPMNSPGETQTTTSRGDQLEPEVIDISSDDGLGSALEHDGGAAASLADDEDPENTDGEVEEDFDDEDIDHIETEEYDEEESKREYYEYLQYMSPNENVTDTDEPSSGAEEEEVRPTNPAEDEQFSDMDEAEAEAESGENHILPPHAPNTKPNSPGKQIGDEVNADHSLLERVILRTQQRHDATLPIADALPAVTGARSLGDALVQERDGMGGLERSPGVKYATRQAVSSQRSPFAIMGQGRGGLEGAVTLDNAYADENAAADINEGNRGEDSAKQDIPAKENPQSRDMNALDSGSSTGWANGKTSVSDVDLPLATYDANEMASSERGQGISHSQSLEGDARGDSSEVKLAEIVDSKMDEDLEGRLEHDVQELGEVSRGGLEQEAAEIDDTVMDRLRRLPSGTLSHSPFVQEPEYAKIKSDKSDSAHVNERETERSSVSEEYATLSETPGSSFGAPQTVAEIVNPVAMADSPNARSSGQPLVPSYRITKQIEEIDLSQIPDPEPYRRFEYSSTIYPIVTPDESGAVSVQSPERDAPVETEDASHGVTNLVSAVDSPLESQSAHIQRNETPRIVSDWCVPGNPMDIDRLGGSMSPSASAFTSSLPKPFYSGRSQGDASSEITSSSMSISQGMTSSNCKQPEISKSDLPVMAEGPTPQTHEPKLSTREDVELPVSAAGVDTTRLSGESVANDPAIAAPSPREKFAKEDGLVRTTHSSIQYPSFQQPIDLEKTPPSSPRQTETHHEAVSGERVIESSILTTSETIKPEILTSEVSSGVDMAPDAPSSTASLSMPQIPNYTTQLQQEGDQAAAAHSETLVSALRGSPPNSPQQQKLQKLGQATSELEQAADKPPVSEVNAQHENDQMELVDSSNASTVPRGTSSRRTTIQGSMSILADVISPWFASRRSSRFNENVYTDKDEERVNDNKPADEHTQSLAPKFSALLPAVPSHPKFEPDIPPLSTSDVLIVSDHGFRTPLSYYTPLSHLPQHLNTVPSPFGNATVDVLAVVSDIPRPPERAKDGPRDYFTVFHVIDTSVTAMLGNKHPDSTETGAGNTEGFRVMVFRPWKASLPTVRPGDVVLLKNFVVKSINGRPSLLSAEYSAWCVWRFGGVARHDRNGDGATPTWARRHSQDTGLSNGGEEECKGPPVEIGSEERAVVKQLRGWWRDLGSKRITEDGYIESARVAHEMHEQHEDVR